jgi:hypothetical protein
VCICNTSARVLSVQQYLGLWMVYELSVYLLKCFAVMSHWLALFRLLLVGGCNPFNTNNAFSIFGVNLAVSLV